MVKKEFSTLEEEFRAKRSELEKYQKILEEFATRYPRDEFLGSNARLFVSYATILKDVYGYIEDLYVENIALKKQIQSLKD
ncbi:hypothetical protein [Nitrososphaera sp.]|uniref:hypothetical protein n=1 Tax=Nitrososphaera sp. TaxID=1971748 RepID=UPI002EDA065A